MIFAKETFLDFTSYDEPFKSRIKVFVHDFLDLTNSTEETHQKISYLKLTEVQLSENPLQNPFNEQPDQEKSYLTVDTVRDKIGRGQSMIGI